MTILRSEHVYTNHKFYMMRHEPIVLPIVATYLFALGSPLLYLGAYWAWTFLVFASGLPYFLIGILPGIKRAEFLRAGGFFTFFDDYFERELNGKKERYQYGPRTVKSYQRNESTIDIVIGGQVSDFLGYFGSGEQQKIEICGVSNGEQILAFLRTKFDLKTKPVDTR